MAKTLSNKNKKADNVDNEIHSRKNSKKRKTKAVVNQNDEEEPFKISKKIKKKRNLKNNEPTTEEKSSKKFKKNESNLDSKKNLSENEEESQDNIEQKPRTISKRQIKREKEEQRKTDKKEASKQDAMNKALNYISMWKHSRSQWKFEKIKQIWLMDNLLDDKAVPNSIFPTVLEYFEGCKGMARETLLKKGMDVIKMCEQKQEETGSRIETVEYKRARELLQALPIET
ncbi:uncharacterized protein C7orf50 homolog [Chelonus insularis]|uniref:uncharacterized protein C7orf50 homolog n=1 Tax=Chelonus insularis TaxID=460826 RepID=UPI00158A401C|nr:uncharacterized protein C7orf50 homolog [Chelonus insularis]XP_034940151.1 uncharacterized protein C7orf50 homolog [Chelonus insularis]